MKIGWITVISLLLTVTASMQEADWQSNTFSLKIIIQEKEQIEQFVFYQPNKFFYIKDEKVHTGTAAKEKFAQFFNKIQLTEESTIESLVSQMQHNGYAHMDRLEIRWLNSKKELYTWVWDSEQT